MNEIKTRASLLNRLKNWRDHESWEDFFNTYWRLIYSVAMKAGMREDEAQDVVQETVLSVAEEMPDFQYDRSKGSFKAWLLRITRRRIADHFEKRQPKDRRQEPPAGHGRRTSLLERIPDPSPDLAIIWEDEWQKHLVDTALERVKQRVSAKQFEIFEVYVIQNWPVRKIAKQLGVSFGQVYVAKHRVSRLVQEEVKNLEKATG